MISYFSLDQNPAPHIVQNTEDMIQATNINSSVNSELVSSVFYKKFTKEFLFTVEVVLKCLSIPKNDLIGFLYQESTKLNIFDCNGRCLFYTKKNHSYEYHFPLNFESIIGFRAVSPGLKFELSFNKKLNISRYFSFRSNAIYLHKLYANFVNKKTKWFKSSFFLLHHKLINLYLDFLIEHFKTSTFIDLGCNKGVHTMYLLKKLNPSQMLLSLDANPIFKKKFKNYETKKNFTFINKAVALPNKNKNKNKNKKLKFYIDVKNDERSSLIKNYSSLFFDSNTRAVYVDFITIDDIIRLQKKQISFVKIDLEGLDVNVITSSKHLFQTRALIVFEFNLIHGFLEAERLRNSILLNNYSCYDIFLNELDSYTFFFPKVCPIDRLLIPNESKNFILRKFKRRLNSSNLI